MVPDKLRTFIEARGFKFYPQQSGPVLFGYGVGVAAGSGAGAVAA